jgi:hypothetical protein
MGKWREVFEAELPPVAERPYRTEYHFGPPAEADQIAAAEAALKVQFPADVREMLSEFNGVWSRSHFDDGREDSDIRFLDLQHMTVEVPRYFAECGGNPLPPKKDRRRVVFVCQSNGFAELWGVCVEDVAGHQAGAVVKLDSEVGEFEPSHASLAAFVRSGPK